MIYYIEYLCGYITGSVLPGSLGTQLQSTSVPGDMENDCKCSEDCSPAVIAVSAVSLLLIVTLATVILTQCLLIIRMRKTGHTHEVYDDVMTPTTLHVKIPVSPNEAYTPHCITSREPIYEPVK